MGRTRNLGIVYWLGCSNIAKLRWEELMNEVFHYSILYRFWEAGVMIGQFIDRLCYFSCRLIKNKDGFALGKT